MRALESLEKLNKLTQERGLPPIARDYNAAMGTAAAEIEREEGAAERRFSLRERLLLWLVTWAGCLLVRLIGPTLRYSVSSEEEGLEREPQSAHVFCFWHRAVIPACWWYRRLGIAVMASRSFDGEFIARIIERFGYVSVRGSSSRGGARALLESHRLIDEGRSVAFTIDGPRGPRYVAKPGPLLLARNTGCAIIPFYICLQRAWVLKTWDAFTVPKPRSRALLRISRKIVVPADANDAELERLLGELQSALDRAREYAEQHVGDPLPRMERHPAQSKFS